MPSPHTRRSRAHRPAAIAAVLGGCLAFAPPATGAPAPPLQDPASYTSVFAMPVAPGVAVTGLRSSTPFGAASSNVVTIDLSRPGVSTGLLSSRVTDIAPVGLRADRSGAVVAVNADYYAIGASNAPNGPAVRGGALQKGLAAKRYVQGVGVDGVARRALLWLDGTVRWGSGAGVPMEGYDSDLDGAAMPTDSVSLFDGGWGDAKVGFARAPAKVSYALVGANGRVLKSSRKFTPQNVPPGGLLLVGTGRWTSIGALTKGTPVVHTQRAATDAPVPFSWAVGAGLELVRNGKVIHNAPDSDTDIHAARTVMGWSQDGRTMKLVTIEKGPGSAGSGANEMADLMKAQGMWEAIDLDGGGSTTLEARRRGTDERDQVGQTQDGFQRAVANAIGVFVPRGSGHLVGIDVGSDSAVVFPGLQRRVRISPYDEWFGPASADVSGAALTGRNGLFTQSGSLLVRARSTGSDIISATVQGQTSSVGLRVLDPLASLVLPDELRLDPGTQTSLQVTGSSSRGERAPIDGLDVSVAPRASAVTAAVGPQGEIVLSAKPGTAGAVVPVSFTVGGVTQVVIVRSGYRDTQLPDLGGRNVWTTRGAKSSPVDVGRHYGGAGLRLILQKQGSTTLKPKAGPVALPADAVRLALNVKADGRRHTVQVLVADAANHTHLVNLGTTGPKKGWTRYDVPLPPGTVQLREVRIVGPGGRQPGEITIDGLISRS